MNCSAKLNFTVEWLAFLLHIQDALCLDLFQETDYPDLSFL
jgi:hypothetical protein